MSVVYQEPAAPSLVLDDSGLDTSFLASQVTMTDKSLENMDFETIQGILFNNDDDDDDTQLASQTVSQYSQDIDIFSSNLDYSVNEQDISVQEELMLQDESHLDFDGFAVNEIHMSRDKSTMFSSFVDNCFF